MAKNAIPDHRAEASGHNGEVHDQEWLHFKEAGVRPGPGNNSDGASVPCPETGEKMEGASTLCLVGGLLGGLFLLDNLGICRFRGHVDDCFKICVVRLPELAFLLVEHVLPLSVMGSNFGEDIFGNGEILDDKS